MDMFKGVDIGVDECVYVDIRVYMYIGVGIILSLW